MANDMIDRNARGVLIAAIADRGRNHATALYLFADEIINTGGGDTHLNQGDDHIQNFSSNAACGAHPCEIRILINPNTVARYPPSKFVHVFTPNHLPQDSRPRTDLPEQGGATLWQIPK